MHFIKKLSLWLALGIFGAGISLFIFTFTAAQTVGKPDVLKGWLEDAEVYQGLVSVASEVEVDTGAEEGEPSLLTAEMLKSSAIDVFKPELIQGSIEDVIDGVYGWLDGSTDKPEFVIDLREAKQAFAADVKDSVREAYENLPVCASRGDVLQAQSSPTNTTCQVPGFDIEPSLNEVEQEILADESFLKDGVYTADNISINGEDEPAYLSFDEAPKYFSLLQKGPLIAVGLMFVSALSALLLAGSIKVGSRKLAWRMITGAIVGLIGAVVLLFGLRAVSRVTTPSNAAAVEDIVIPFVNQMIPDFILYSAVISGILLALGGVIIFATRSSKPKKQDNQQTPKPKTPFVT